MTAQKLCLIVIVAFSVLCSGQESSKGSTEEAAPVAAKPVSPGAAIPTEQRPLLPALPAPVSGNAVATLKSHGATLMFSFMGMGPKKTWDDISNSAFYLDPDWDQWYPLRPVPGTAGRIDASAIGVQGNVFLFGGVVVDAHNQGMIIPDVNIYSPGSQTWLRGSDIPTPVADSVIGVYRDRFIYLLGGRSNHGVVSSVQIYDVEKSRWLQAAPLPGHAVFGHAGAVLDDVIVYVDGAYLNSLSGPRFVPSDECWMGKIDRKDPTQISWSKLPPHPGNARFGIAAGASEKERKIYFTGGTDNPDVDTGTGFNGKPSQPVAYTFAWNLRTEKWETISSSTPNPTMNNRGLLVLPDMLAVAGGMEKGQTPTRRVNVLLETANAHSRE